jgi:hypothetical protein
MAEVGRKAAPRVVRLVAAGAPGPAGGEIRFHRRLTVLADARPGLAEWVVSLVAAHAPPDTLLEIDGMPARTYDLPRAVRALPPAEPLRPKMLQLLALGHDLHRPGTRGRTSQQVADELVRWERVLGEARLHLVRVHEAAPRVDPVDLAEAARLRNEWRYAVRVDRWERRRRSRRRAHASRASLDGFLANFGASSYEDLSMVGTGFGDTAFDVAIREAATVVSMAEQRCHKLRMELEETRRNEALSDDERAARIAAALDAVDLASLDAERADRLLARALAELDDTAYVRPLVVDGVLDALAPPARHRGFDRLVSHSRRRQIVLVTGLADVARRAARSAPDDVALRLDAAGAPAIVD